MAHRGPAPKNVRHGRSPVADWTDVSDVPYDGPSPELPRLPRRGRWHPMVVSWWEQLRTMPHCALWRDTDWTYAIETAFMKQAYWVLAESGEATTAAAVEIRRREDQLGTTREALRKLRIRYVADRVADGDLEEAEPPVEVVEVAQAGGGGTVHALSTRRARLIRRA